VKLVIREDLHLFNSIQSLQPTKPSQLHPVTKGYSSKDNHALSSCQDQNHVAVSEVASEEVVVWIEIAMVVVTEVVEVVVVVGIQGTGMAVVDETGTHPLPVIDTAVVVVVVAEIVMEVVVVVVVVLVVPVVIIAHPHHVMLAQVGMMTGHHLRDIAEVVVVLGVMMSLVVPLPVGHLLGNEMIIERGRVLIEGIRGMAVDGAVVVVMTVMVVTVAVVVVVVVMLVAVTVMNLVMADTIAVIVMLEVVVIEDVDVVHHEEVMVVVEMVVLLLETDTITTGPEVAHRDIDRHNNVTNATTIPTNDTTMNEQ